MEPMPNNKRLSERLNWKYRQIPQSANAIARRFAA